MEALKVADIIISFFDYKGDLITNKKLQKLLYYVESWSLVHTSSLIDEDFEAWVHGPVIPSVYREYKKFGYSAIRNEYAEGQSSSSRLEELTASGISEEQKELLFQVLDKYGGMASYQLETLTHAEEPWKSARKECDALSHSSNIITKDSMRNYYSSLLNGK